LERRMSKGLGVDQIKVYWSTNIDIIKLVGGVSQYTYAYLLVVGVMLSHNLIRKIVQSVVYASRLMNITKHNYNIRVRKVLTMVFALHKFKHYLLGNKFVFYVDHMALVYLVNKS
jgi:hypothetical protein